MCEVEHRSERSNETEPSATMLAPSNDWQPSDPCSSSQSSRPMDEYVPSIYSAAWKFRIETFFRIIDTLITECKERTAAYSIVNLRFRFLTEFHDMSVAAFEEESKAFVSVYGSDVDDSFPNEMMHFIEFIGKEKNKCSADAKYNFESKCDLYISKCHNGFANLPFTDVHQLLWRTVILSIGTFKKPVKINYEPRSSEVSCNHDS